MNIDFFKLDLEDDPFDFLSEEELDELLGKEDFELPNDLVMDYGDEDDDGLFDYEDDYFGDDF